MSATVVENVDGYEITWTDDAVTIKFTDLFGAGEVYLFDKADATAIRDALTRAIEEMA